MKKNQLSTPRRVVDNVSIASLEHEILIDLKNSHTSPEIEKKIYLRDAQAWLLKFLYRNAHLGGLALSNEENICEISHKKKCVTA